MAKIVQVLTRASKEYDLETAESQVRDLDAIVEKSIDQKLGLRDLILEVASSQIFIHK